jgi:hypothetical protein
MRGLNLYLDGTHSADTLSWVSRNSPGELSFPKLEWLYLAMNETCNFSPFFNIFLSPRLQHVTFHSNLYSSHVSRGRAAALTQIVSVLPTSLEALAFMCGRGEEDALNDAISSLICRCGPSLRSFDSDLPLSEAAIHHLMQLPNLSYWRTTQGPPRAVSTSIFPSLEKLDLYGQEALPWLHLLASHEKGILPKGSASARSHTNIGEALKFLDCPDSTIIDSTFLSSIVRFRSLVRLQVHTVCPRGGVDGCFFRIADDDVKDLAAALPHLSHLRLGQPCYSNTCNTTVTSLMSISAHCPDLAVLETHFNTRTIVSDMRRLLDGDAGRDEAKCKLRKLCVGIMPLEVREEDIQAIARGFNVIFPYLTDIGGYYGSWSGVVLKMKD